MSRRAPTQLCLFILLLAIGSANATVVQYSYDAGHRLIGAAYTNGAAHAFTYDNSGNLLQSADLVPDFAPFEDSDNDGLPDSWELQYFGNLSRDGSADYDGDGASDLDEYLLGTNPTDAASLLRIIPPPMIDSSGVTIVWSAVPGKTYRLQYRNVFSSGGWSDVPGDVTAAGATAQKLDATAAGQPARFYRVALVVAGAGGDSDSDGLADSWEQQYFSTLARDGSGDFDSDGMTDTAEFLAGTLPNNPNSILKILPNPAVTNGNVTIQWQAVSGKTYRLQFKNSLSDANWQNVPGDVTAAGSTASKQDSTTNGQSVRYYRVLLAP